MDAAAQQLADQSDKFHAFEWLRGLALAGNKHAQVILAEGNGVMEDMKKLGADEAAARKICSNCKWWSHEPLPNKTKIEERICLKSRIMGFGAYGLDGRAIIVTNKFGCNGWEGVQ